jgi:short-chain fatty acids transporter
MIAGLGKTLSRWSERFVPSPFVLALVLTVLTFVLAVVFGHEVAGQPYAARIGEVASGWYSGFYGSAGLTFALQMCIVLVTGHALAISGPVRRGIERVATMAGSPKAAALLVALVACLASLVQWGLGAIVGAFMAREVGRVFEQTGREVHYPLLGAAGYAGFLVWHGGFSGSAPLKVAEEGHFVADIIGVVPISQTLLSPTNLVITGAMLVTIPALFYGLMPTDRSEMEPPDLGEENSEKEEAGRRDRDAHPVVELLEQTRFLNVALGGLLLGYLVYYFATEGVAGWQLNSINLLFLALGILVYPSPRSYVRAFTEGVQSAAGIVLQFPFYFGILGLLKASGLIEQVAQFFVSISTATTFPIFSFLSAGIVNFFVPSGGGQWAVQGQVMMEAAQKLGVPIDKAIMAFSYGDAWTNMLQPFWALPLLGIMDLEARQIIGYTALVMFVTGPMIMGLLVIL